MKKIFSLLAIVAFFLGISEAQAVTFKFSSSDPDLESTAYTCVNLVEDDYGDEIPVDLTGNEVSYMPEAYFMPFFIMTAKEGYVITNIESDDSAVAIQYMESLDEWDITIGFGASDNPTITTYVSKNSDVPGPENPDTYSIILAFAGETDAWNYITIKDDNNQILNLAQNYVFEYESDDYLYYTVADGYSITSITCSNSSFLSYIYEEDEMINITPAMNGVTITFNIEKVITVSFGFTSEDPELADNAWEYVYVIDDNDDSEISLSGKWNEFSYAADSYIYFIPKDGYQITKLIAQNSDYSDYIYRDKYKGTDAWLLNLTTRMDGTKFLAYISTSAGGGNQDNNDYSVILNFVGNGIENPYEFVNVSYEYTFSETEEKGVVTINENPFTYVYDEYVLLTFTPKENYSVYIEGPEDVIINNPSLAGGTATINLGFNLPLNSEFIITVTDLLSTGVNSTQLDNNKDIIFNLQGIQVSKDKLTPGIYIVNGKKRIICK